MRYKTYKVILPAILLATSAATIKAQSFSEALKNSIGQQKDDTIVIVQPEKYLNQASTYYNQATLQTITTAYGCSFHRFNKVVAVGPAQMTAFNDIPAVQKDDNVGDQQTLNQFVASLDQAQWRLFTSLQGIGINDLQSPEQVKLLRYFLRTGTTKTLLNFEPREDLSLTEKLHGIYEMAKNPFLSDDEVNAVRLRLGIKNEIELPVKGRMNGYADIGVASDPTVPYSPFYQFVYGGVDQTKNAASPFYSMPNSPKQSDIDYTQSFWGKPVDISASSNLKQIYESVNSCLSEPAASITTVTGSDTSSVKSIEITFYAHPAYQNMAVAVLGNKRPVMSDLLQAVAYSITGSYRKVDDIAYLTNDVTGAAQHYYKYKTQLDNNEAGMRSLSANSFSPAGLSDTWDSLPLSPHQRSYIYTPNGLRESMDISWDELNSAQKDLVQRMADKLARYTNNKVVIDDTCKPRIIVKPLLQALLPSLDAPASIVINASAGKLFPMAVAQQQTSISSNLPVNSYNIKALYVPYLSITSVDDLIQRASDTGYNHLWIDISQQLPLMRKDNKEYLEAAELFKKAIKSAEPIGMQVSLYADPFAAGLETDPADLDQSIIGQDQHHCHIKAKALKPHTDTITSLSAAIGKLNSLVIAVSNDTYGACVNSAANLGYTVDEREAFIRKTQVDPIDILPADVDPELKKLAIDYTLSSSSTLQQSNAIKNYAAEWKRFYSKDVDQAVAAICSGLSDNVALPIYLRKVDQSVNLLPYYTRWSKSANPAQKIIIEKEPNSSKIPSQDNVAGYLTIPAKS